jgi:inosine-uridine nucleoside N-ribohydrolase
MQCVIDVDRLDEIWSTPGPRAAFVRMITERKPSRVLEDFGVEGLFAADPVAMAAALNPGIVTKSERRHVTVELGGRHTRGQTTVDWFGLGREPPTVDVILELDRGRFLAMLSASVR